MSENYDFFLRIQIFPSQNSEKKEGGGKKRKKAPMCPLTQNNFHMRPSSSNVHRAWNVILKASTDHNCHLELED